MIPPRLHTAVVTAAAALVLLTNLGGPALWDEDEPKNAACSLAMLDRGDWIVPVFNGRLRVEKPALVNWVHIAGFALAGRNETGARLGSAALTIGTAVLCGRIGLIAFGSQAGLLAGLAMATCVWTAVGGRSATPDAPLVFFTTLGLWCHVAGRTADTAGPGRWRSGWHAAACGSALGAAMLAKGPVGFVLPCAAFVASALWEAAAAGGTDRRGAAIAALRALRLPLVSAAALAVALPWYALVTLRTGGDWPAGFFLVHNVGRFAAPMEGHHGPALLYYPMVLAVGFFPWSIVLAATLIHAAVASRADDAAPPARTGVRLMLCWLACWTVAFSAAGTKLPGYVWPAYPALAVLTGDFLAAWAAGTAGRWPSRLPTLDAVMRLAWSILLLAGGGVAAGLLLAAAGMPRLAALAPVGLLPVAGALLAWRCQSRGRRAGALVSLAVTSCLFVSLLAAAGADVVGGARGAKRLVAALRDRPSVGAWAGFGSVPPSVVFYAGDDVPQLHSTEAVTAHLESRRDAHLLVDARFEMNLPSTLPPGYGVIAREPPLFGPGLLVIGPLAHSAGPTAPSPENPLAWNPPAPNR